MKFLNALKNLALRLKNGISRFSIPFAFSLLMFVLLTYEIFIGAGDPDTFSALCFATGFGLVISILLKIIAERVEKFTIHTMAQSVISIATAVVCFVLVMAFSIDNAYVATAYFGLIIAIVCFGFYLLSRGENELTIFPCTVSSAVFTTAVCGILSAGISICLAAFQNLIYDFKNAFEIYSTVNLFVWVVVWVNMFLSFIPEKNTKVESSKIYKAFSLYAGLPLYMLLIVILLVYLGKIIITWNMPIGEINWFASFAALFFIFFLLSVRQYEEKVPQLFTKYGGYLLIPVLIMQAIAVFERVNAYGLTTPRTVSIVLIIIGASFIVTSLISQKHLSKIYLAAGIVVLLVTITPLNIISMPKMSQTNILKTVLIKNNMLSGNTITPNSDISEEDAERIISAFDYLKYAEGELPDFLKDTKNKTTMEVFGVEEKYGSYATTYYCSYRCKGNIDISEYDKMIKAYDDHEDIIKISVDGTDYDIDTKELGRELYDKYGESNDELDLYIISDKIALYIESLHFDMSDVEMKYCNFDGYVLLKN